MMTTRMSCRLNCLICHMSGFHGLVVRLVQVSGLSCVSHDAVRQGTPFNEVSERLVGSSLRIVLAPIAPHFVPTQCPPCGVPS